MTRRTGTFLSLAALIAVVQAAMAEPRSQQPSPAATPRPSRTMREMVMMPVVYRVPGMDNVVVRSDLRYTTVSDPHLSRSSLRSRTSAMAPARCLRSSSRARAWTRYPR